MRKVFGILIALVSIFAVSCAKDDGSDMDFVINRAELAEVIEVGSNGLFKMMWDDSNSILNVVENEQPDYEVYEGQRVYCRFRILKVNKDESYYVKLINFHSLATSKTYLQSEVDNSMDLQSQLGNDPIIGCDNAWIKRNWMNVEISFYRDDPTVEHSFSLVWHNYKTDDVHTGNGTELRQEYFTLRHNAFRSPNMQQGTTQLDSTMGSFDISGSLIDIKEKTEIYLRWESENAIGEIVINEKLVGVYDPAKAGDSKYTVITEESRNYFGPPVNTSTFVR